MRTLLAPPDAPIICDKQLLSRYRRAFGTYFIIFLYDVNRVPISQN